MERLFGYMSEAQILRSVYRFGTIRPLKSLQAKPMKQIKVFLPNSIDFELFKIDDDDFEKTWKQINEPFGKHVTQIQIYMKLAELIGYPDVPQEAVIIYEAKATQDVKEFVIPKSDFSINHIFAAAEKVVKAVDNLTPLDCNISPTGCKKCEGYTNESN
jgi:hypothetical protein